MQQIPLQPDLTKVIQELTYLATKARNQALVYDGNRCRALEAVTAATRQMDEWNAKAEAYEEAAAQLK